MKKLTRKEALKLLEKYEVDGRILRHSLAVNKFAVFLAERLRKKGLDVDVYLVDMGSLLHDIRKTHNGKVVKNHDEAGGKLLMKEGYPVIAKIVEKHGLPGIDFLQTWEEKIVFYADKRLDEDKVVSLDERYKELEKRYPKSVDSIRSSVFKVKKLETEIKGIIKI